MGLIIRPDCADLPYFLRAYFAFKMGLPFGYSKCTRGAGGEAPRCPQWWNIQNLEPPPPPPEPKIAAAARTTAAVRHPVRPVPPAGRERAPPPPCSGAERRKPLGLAASFGQYLRTVADGVHSGSGRTRAERRQHRLLSRAAEPGRAASGDRLRRSVRTHAGARAARAADRRARRASCSRSTRSPTGRSRASASGAAISCSRTIPRSAAPASSASGRSCRRTAALRRLTNDEIAKNPQYADFSLDQSKLGSRSLLRSHG